MTANQGRDRSQDLSRLASYVRRGCSDREVKALVLQAMASPNLVAAKRTTSGIRLHSALGMANTHFTPSDRRAVLNFRATLRRIGLIPSTR